ncbi:hypothetical protein JXO52_08670 [bacterium]|nr:hypothetical protein [bacterium]
MKIERLTPEAETAWDRYAAGSGTATFFHRVAWRDLVESVLGYESSYLVARDRGRVRGILPLFLVGSSLAGRRLISLPFSTRGGICADTAETGDALIRHAV